MKRIILVFLCAGLFIAGCDSGNPSLDLAGTWNFELDPDDAGVREEWFNRRLANKITLPGSLQEQGYGHDVDVNTRWTGQIVDRSWFDSGFYARYREPGNIKIPFWLQPEKHYVGAAWYQREINIPGSWKGKYIEAEFERTHWETTLYLDGEEIGGNNALQTPHRYRIGETGKHMLTVRVDNRLAMPVGINAHSVSDHTQSNWNGIIGSIKLTARPSLYIEDVSVYPDLENKTARVSVTLGGEAGVEAEVEISTEAFNTRGYPPKVRTVSGKYDTGSSVVAVLDIPFGDGMLTWSEFEPNLYRSTVKMKSDKGTDEKTVEFGMREFKAEGRRFYVNGSPVFLRGTLECAIFPLTGYSSMEPEYWEKIYRKCKEYGLNHVRFHSWCPPEVAFEMADREGIYLQVECGMWCDIVGNGTPIDDWLYEESRRIVKEYGNHPSFCLMAHGNEPGGRNQVEYLGRFVEYWKDKDPRRVYTSSGGWPYIENADYWNTPSPRIQAWGGGLNSIINSQPPKTDFDFREIIQSVDMPSVSHEIGQWCVYPNFGEIEKYTGVLKPKNFEIFRETLAEHHLGDLSEDFLYASGRLQTLCYKADIEAALRTPGFAGFQLLDIHDFPGQGTALVGVLDPFWDDKGYVDGAEFSSFCNRTVPLARLGKMTYHNTEKLKAHIEVAHFGQYPLANTVVEWDIKDSGGKVHLTGSKAAGLPVDNCIGVGDIELDLASFDGPERLSLTVRVPDEYALNSWDIWVYPEVKNVSGTNVYRTSDLEDALSKANSGASVLYCLPKDKLKPEKGGDIAVGFSSIFWNTAWTRGQAPHVLGVYCDPSHPVFGLFPNEGYSTYQWWDIVANSSAMVMDDFPAECRPLVHLIDDWFRNRKLGLLFETKVGKGKMMVTSIDLDRDMENRPSSGQLKHSIETYMASGDFNPATEIDVRVIRDMLK